MTTEPADFGKSLKVNHRTKMFYFFKKEGWNRQFALVLVSFFLYGSAVIGYCFWSNHYHRVSLQQEIDGRLSLAAQSLKYLLAPDFHDRAIGPDTIGRDEERRNRQAVSGYAAETEFEYLYTKD